MTKMNGTRLIRSTVYCCIVYLLIACSHNPIFSSPNQSQTTLTIPIDPKTISPNTASKLVASKQVNRSDANSFIWLSGGRGIVMVTNTGLDLFRLTTSKTFEPVTQLQTNNPTLVSISQLTGVIAWTGKDNLIHLWDIDKQITLPSMGAGNASITGLSFSPTQYFLVQAGVDQSISIWDVGLQQQIINWNASAWLTELTFSPGGEQIAGVDLVGFSLEIFDADTGEVVQKKRWGDSASAVLYTALLSPDWHRIAWVSRGIVQITETSGAGYGPLLTHEDYVSDVAWSPNSQVLATASGATVDGQFSPVVLLWDVQTGILLNTLVQQAAIVGLDFSPDGHELAILLSGGVLQIWTIE